VARNLRAHLSAAVVAVVAVVVAAGCANTTVTTVTTTVTAAASESTPPTATTHAPRHRDKSKRAARVPAQRSVSTFIACDQNISAKAATTTCRFAENTFYEYWDSGESFDVSVYSPAAGHYFDTTCTPGEGWIVCTTEDGGVVRFTQAAVDRYTPDEAKRYAAAADLGPDGNLRSESPSSPPPSSPPPSPPDAGPNPSNEIPNYSNGTGYPVQCLDGTWSHSGGRPGACSYHGGVR
jgi:hypothetical protein